MLVGLGVKAAAAVGLTGGSYLLGTLPSCLGLNQSCGHSLLLSLVLCFGGGVLFATSVVHVLSEASVLGSEWANIVFCMGFMGLYLLDELIKLCEGGGNKANCQLEVKGLLDTTIHHQYNSIDEHDHHDNLEEQNEQGENISVQIKSSSNKIGLLLAFSIHSIIEGLVIGVQPIPAKVLLLVGAVSSHKLVVAFCLGAELASDGRSFLSLSQSMLVYSLGSSVGIVLGMVINQWKSNPDDLSIPVLQALTAGSLLFITASEVLPRERSRWEHRNEHYFAGFMQFLCFTLGFSAIASLVLLT